MVNDVTLMLAVIMMLILVLLSQSHFNSNVMLPSSRTNHGLVLWGWKSGSRHSGINISFSNENSLDLGL